MTINSEPEITINKNATPKNNLNPQIYQTEGMFYADRKIAKINGFAIASLICGISQFVLFWLFIPAPLAVIFGHIALSQMKHKINKVSSSFAIVGLVLGYIGLALLPLIILSFI